MHDQDIAALLFPTEANTAPQQAPEQADRRGAAPAAPAPAQRPADDADKAIREAFPTEAAPDPAKSVGETMTPWADSLQAEGEADRADEMRAVSTALADDFRHHGMTADDTAEIMGLARQALGSLPMPGLPVDDDRLAQMRANAESWIAENQITETDLNLARRLVADLDAKTGGRVSEHLTHTGMGNDPRAIQRAVDIAKRRYGGG